MKILVFEDSRAAERNSHGVYLVRKPEGFGDRILFYCDEWMWLWDDIREVGNPDRAVNAHLNELELVDANEFLSTSVSEKVSYVLEIGPAGKRRLPYVHK
ncbi:hypothetical protein IWQ54_001100 [Labrenzia sp. EL_195]|nr:hypothetical protein [Labrenzia sp. EL_195]